MNPSPDPASLAALKRHGAEAVSFQALKAGAQWWVDVPSPEGTGARLAYVPSGGSWIAIGTPLVEDAARARAIQRFMQAARAAGRRPVFFGVEDRTPFADGRALLLGLQSVLRPSQWDITLRQRPRLREQLRRARAKGVRVRQVEASELVDGAPMRQAVEELQRQWLASRHMEPMSFLVSVEPCHASDEHLYYVAERDGVAVQFLSAVPIYARHGWLMEDMLRGHAAPNGTTELVIDALMRRLEGDPRWVTPGLTPLSGAIAWWLRLARGITVPLYDFSGLRHFRARLRPDTWQPIWMTWDRGPALGPLIDVIKAFAGGRVFAFAIRSLLRHPSGPPWAVAVPLVPWTVLLAALAVVGDAHTLGFSVAELRAWVVFDAVLAWLLFRVAKRPRRISLAPLAALAGFDAVLSLRHLMKAGWGDSATSALMRVVATAGPIVGTAALIWAIYRVQATEQRTPRDRA